MRSIKMLYEETMSPNGIRENIEKFGWQFQWVFDSNNELESFCYSIGFEESYNHPEIIIFDLARETSKIILSELAKEIKNGKVFTPNQRNPDVLSGGFEVMFKEIKPSAFSKYLGIAKDYYKRPFKAYVMLWPDKNNILPIESGCSLTSQSEAIQII